MGIFITNCIEQRALFDGGNLPVVMLLSAPGVLSSGVWQYQIKQLLSSCGEQAVIMHGPNPCDARAVLVAAISEAP